MKIVSLQSENIKRIVAVEIKPDGNMVQITGKNGAGKTSVLDSIWWCLAGAANIQRSPIREGERLAKIRLDLGELFVTRTFIKSKESETVTTGITVETASGSKFDRPQTVLDELLGHLSFDPLDFARMASKDQFKSLRRFVPDVDFESIEQFQESDFIERTAISRKAKEAKIYAEKIEAPVNKPPARINEAEIIAELTKASDHNSDIARRQENRKQLAIQEKQHMATAEDFEQQAKEMLRKVQESKERAVKIRGILHNTTELPQPMDVSVIQQRLESAQEVNAVCDLVEKKLALIVESKEHERQAAELTEKMNQRELDKQSKIAAAKMPVKALSFGKGFILLNGIPFEQASDAEKLHVSVAIAMALNPKLKVIRIRDGSLLDKDSLALIAKMADEGDFQIWIETVATNGKVGFVIEDGKLKPQEVES